MATLLEHDDTDNAAGRAEVALLPTRTFGRNRVAYTASQLNFAKLISLGALEPGDKVVYFHFPDPSSLPLNSRPPQGQVRAVSKVLTVLNYFLTEEWAAFAMAPGQLYQPFGTPGEARVEVLVKTLDQLAEFIHDQVGPEAGQAEDGQWGTLLVWRQGWYLGPLADAREAFAEIFTKTTSQVVPWLNTTKFGGLERRSRPAFLRENPEWEALRSGLMIRSVEATSDDTENRVGVPAAVDCPEFTDGETGYWPPQTGLVAHHAIPTRSRRYLTWEDYIFKPDEADKRRNWVIEEPLIPEPQPEA